MNPEPGGLNLRFEVDGDDFTSAGQASVQVKKSLRQLGISPDIIRKVSIAMYEGEINMVIHAHGGDADVTVDELVVESFYPADAATAEALRPSSGGAGRRTATSTRSSTASSSVSGSP